ncbi:MAG: hypothetical protein WBA57_27280 [Elainellaceae cyanobacterium]
MALISVNLPTITSAQEIDESEMEQANQRLQDCTPSVTELPSLLSAFGVDTINRIRILGEQDGLCLVNYTFAYPEQPDEEAVYLACQFSDETIQQVTNQPDQSLDISDECVFNENWMNEI